MRDNTIIAVPSLTVALIPQPHRFKVAPGLFRVPVEGVIFTDSEEMTQAAEAFRSILGNFAVRVDETSRKHLSSIHHISHKRKGYYSLKVSRSSIRIQASDSLAALNAIRTLTQIRAQHPGDNLPCLSIEDWPDFSTRAIYYDVTRGRVPAVDRIKEQVALLASMKINQYQLYFEHTCFFPSHPYISRRASPYSASDILEIDNFCRSQGVELVPSLATFGHMTRILGNKHLRHLSEDLGTGSYATDTSALPAWQLANRAATISPANSGTYPFLDQLFDDFLPLFSSCNFNVCCDEVFDLGLGQTHDLCRQHGKPTVFLEHVKKLHSMAGQRGKRIMLWGDMIHRHDLASLLPKDITILDWNYDHNCSFAPLKQFRSLGCETIACPGTSSWKSLFPRIHEASMNISRTAKAAKRMGAAGLMTTDWGDSGHANFMEYSWLGYAMAAEKAWNASSDESTFVTRFCRIMFGTHSPKLTKAILDLGDVSHTSANYYQSIWWHILAAPAHHELFTGRKRNAWISKSGAISRESLVLGPVFARKSIKLLTSIRKTLERTSSAHGTDPHGLLPYWIFAVDLTTHAARKLEVFSTSKRPDKYVIEGLTGDLDALISRFETLWLSRNRKSEIRTTLRLFRKVGTQYRQAILS